MGVIVIGLGTPPSAGENFRNTWEHLGALATSLGTPVTSLGAPAAILGAPRITVEQSGNNIIFFGNVAGAPGNNSYYLSFNDYENSCIQFAFSSMYLYSYPTTNGISGLAAGSA